MIHYHNDEFPTVEKALAYLLQHIRNQMSFEEKVQVMNRIMQLFDSE